MVSPTPRPPLLSLIDEARYPFRLGGPRGRLHVMKNYPPLDGFEHTTRRLVSDCTDYYATHNPIIMKIIYFIAKGVEYVGCNRDGECESNASDE